MAKVYRHRGSCKKSSHRLVQDRVKRDSATMESSTAGVSVFDNLSAQGLLPEPLPADRRVFERLYREELAFVERTVLRYGVRAEDAADLTQEIFAAVYQRISIYDETRPARPWLYAFAVRVAKDYRSRSRHRLEFVCADLPDVISEEPSAEQMLLAHAEQQIAVMALEGLPVHLREILVRHDVEEMKMPDIAKTLGIPVDTGYTRLRRARKQLRSRVSSQLDVRRCPTAMTKEEQVKEIFFHPSTLYRPGRSPSDPPHPDCAYWAQAA